MKKGVDVSKWNISWTGEISRKNGDSFAIIRAGFGKGNIDRLADKHYQSAIGAGLAVGLYWFSYAHTPEMAREEAKFLLNYAKGKRILYPLIYDYEYDSRDLYYSDKDTINRMGIAFCEEIEKAGYYAMIYSNKDYRENIWDKDVKQRYDMWYARYNDSWKNEYPKCHMLQYTNQKIMSGKRYDGNYDFLDFPTIIKKRGLNHING